jgi:hypothetical protein
MNPPPLPVPLLIPLITPPQATDPRTTVTTTSSSSHPSTPSPNTPSDYYIPESTWSTLSYTATTTKQILRSVVDRLGIAVPPGSVTKELLASLLISNRVRFPNQHEDITQWSLTIQPLGPSTRNNETTSSTNNKRRISDASIARKLHNKLNGIIMADSEQSDSEYSHENTDPHQTSNNHSISSNSLKKAKHSQPPPPDTTTTSPSIDILASQLAEQRGDMQKLMQLFQTLQRNFVSNSNQPSSSSGNSNTRIDNRISRDNTNPGINPTIVNSTSPLVYSCSNISCDYKSTDLQEKFCKLHGVQMIAEQLKLVQPSGSTLQTANTTNARGGVNNKGLNATTNWNQFDNTGDSNNVDNRHHNNSNYYTGTNGTQGNTNSITINNTIEPTFPFAQIHSLIPEKVIQDARKGKYVPLVKFLPSANAMKHYETEQGLESSTVPFYKLAQALEDVKNSATVQSISSPFQLLQAFGGGLIPAACEGNASRLVDYQLFLLEIIALMQQQHWPFVLAYVEEVRRSRQAVEASWTNHKLAAGNDSGLHQETWLKQLAKFQQQNQTKPSPAINYFNNVQFGTGSNNNSNTSAPNSIGSRNADSSTSQELCRFFAENGRCRFGNNCRHLHDAGSGKGKKRKGNTPSVTSTARVNPTAEHAPDPIKSEQN